MKTITTKPTKNAGAQKVLDICKKVQRIDISKIDDENIDTKEQRIALGRRVVGNEFVPLTVGVVKRLLNTPTVMVNVSQILYGIGDDDRCEYFIPCCFRNLEYVKES